MVILFFPDGALQNDYVYDETSGYDSSLLSTCFGNNLISATLLTYVLMP